MTHDESANAPSEAWDDGTLGASEEFVRVSTDLDEDTVNRTLDLHPISIRLQKSLIDDLKHIAAINGIGYQPLVRQVLSRFVESEKKKLLREKRRELDEDCDGSERESGNDKAATG